MSEQLGEARVENLLKQALAFSEADETEAVLSASSEALTRFAHNAIHQNVAETDATLDVRAIFAGRLGSAATNDLSPAGLERAVRLASEMARHRPADPHWPGLPEPQPWACVATYDEAVARMTPEARARAIAEICGAARASQLLASGAFSTAQSEYAVMNSNGLFAYTLGTEADLTFVMEQPEANASAFAHATGWQLAQIDFDALQAKAVRQALAARHPRPMKAGEYTVVLEPYAVLTLLEALIADGMGALAVQEERSWMNQRFGQPCLSPHISIVDDAFDAHGFPRPFDCEGAPKRRVPIVVNGVPTSPVHDRQTAARVPGQATTGHAQPYTDEDWDGPLPENLSLAPGALSVDNMVREIERGLYITRFWYVRPTGAPNVAATGTTRDGVWRIERGELTHPVTNLRFDQELLAALAPGRVRGVGRDRATLAGLYGTHRLPALALDGFRFIDVGDEMMSDE